MNYDDCQKGSSMKGTILLYLIVFCFHAYGKTKILFLGDSLTFGYGIKQEYAYPTLLQKKFDEEKIEVEVINAGISGSTTASGPSRLKWFLKNKPDLLFLALGANDGLRGLELNHTKKNLEDVIKLAKENNIKVLLAGMILPPNYGKKYQEDFEKIFKELASSYKLPFFPFLLKDVGGKKELNIADGIHPNEKGHAIIANNLYPFLKAEL